ncbi:uncharacterized protein LOC128236110 [Mya arenaria]|uniref:uncharacterized protein LOC128236110 n=1 Tax=Mya arenaria TaxID=6604 RepID=UPI0022E329E2|nr:uncharacterized protein LOC128236110 [Mya arenaria]
MATGGASLYKGSDLIHDYGCSKCEEHDRNTEAQHFCQECEHYLCDNCVKLHNGYHKKHTVYGRGDIQKWAGFALDKCDQHGNKLEVHCDDHQELCCHVCVALNHRQCSSISHLPDLSRDFLKTAEFKQLPVAVDKMRSRLGELTNARLKYQASLTDMYKDILAEIKALRKKMNNILDHLEKKTVKELDSMIKGLETNIKVDIDACTHMHDQLKTMIKKVQQMTGKHKETNSYIGYRRCQDKLDKAEEQMQTMQRKPEPRISFKPDSSLQPFLNNLHVFGSIEKFEILHVYKALDFKTYYVKENDNFRFSIVGICELPSGDLVIANKKNSKVIFLNRQYDVTASCDLPFPPEDLCLISGNEVAISVNDSIRHEVHFINVTRGKLQKVTHSTTVHWCFSVAYHQGRLFVSSGNTLYQYNMDGNIITKIYEDKSIGLTVNRCVLSPDGERIYVTNYLRHKLITLDKTGKVLCSLEDTELENPSGLCISPRGHVFVWGMKSDTVIQVDREGTQKMATLVRKADGLSKPQSLCFSEQTSSLLVGNTRIISVCIQLTSGVRKC